MDTASAVYSVDNFTQFGTIQTETGTAAQGRTSFVIAHRLSTIRDADTIILMDGGRIVEEGSHADLLRSHGVYYNLYNSQFTEAPAAAG